MTDASVCKLCRRERPLQLSHIIPRFAVKWLKETSLTGYVRDLVSGARRQETRRERLLCTDCEQLLGRDERQFREGVFYPYHNSREQVFEYGPWLKRFLVGLHWRVLVSQRTPYPDDVRGTCDQTAEVWRKFLLGQRNGHGGHEFHVFLADSAADSTEPLPAKFNWYMARGFDAAPAFSEAGDILVYAKLVKIITVSFVTPRDPKREDWEGTLVGDQGTLRAPQQMRTTGFGQFLKQRARLVEEHPSPMTERQKGKVRERTEADPEKVLTSESFRVYLADRQLQASLASRSVVKGSERNKPCPCGSGRKAKECCFS